MIAADRPCPDDLVVRGQRGQLSQIEQRVVDAHLEQCASCRAALAVARLFDAIPDRQPDDEQLIARVASRATRSREGISARRWLQVAAAALIALASGAATATWITLRRHESKEAHEAEPPSLDRRARRAPLPARMAPTEAPETPEAAADSPASVPTAPPLLSGGRGRRQASQSADWVSQPRDAASLFAEANAVRRNGELRRAIGLYRTLQRQFPESSQSRLASLSLGDLLLGLGDPAGALVAFDSYLAHPQPGPLTEEALFGRARCLARLHRAAEERQTWGELVHRYPRSAYRPAADRRLAELGR